MVAHRRRIPGVGKAMNSAGNHSADIGVDDGHPLAIREAGHRTRGVGADTRKFKESVDVIGHQVVVIGRDRDSALVQPLRAARIAELAPGPQHIGGTRCSRRRRGWPARDPVHPDRCHPCHRGLLQHELADQDLPWAHARSAPRQIALGTGIPLDEIVRGDAHRLAISVAVHNTVHGEYQPGGGVDGTQAG